MLDLRVISRVRMRESERHSVRVQRGSDERLKSLEDKTDSGGKTIRKKSVFSCVVLSPDLNRQGTPSVCQPRLLRALKVAMPVSPTIRLLSKPVGRCVI